jgi:rhamnose utilization protein RhaD (predicted bifunctional aldolase and dehydrogenase)
MNLLHEKRRDLVALSQALGAEHRQLAILGEGNTSARLSDHTFLVKASGSSLGTLRDEDVVECRFDALLPLIDLPGATHEAFDETLHGCRMDRDARKPSIEALFHAWLLSLPGIEFVGHTHPVAVNAILCSPLGARFAPMKSPAAARAPSSSPTARPASSWPRSSASAPISSSKSRARCLA